MNEFTENVINIIRNIPKGKVMTYGRIARNAGNPKGARQVSRILATMSKKYNLPWHRVINSKGEISLKEESKFIQKALLIDEGVVFKDDTIDLKKYMHFII